MMVAPRSRVNRDAIGQSLTEFALLLPVLLAIMLGGLDLGRVFFAYVTVQNASREGARYAIGDPNNVGSIAAHARQEDPGLLGSAPVDVSCLQLSDNSSIPCSSAKNGDRIRVTVRIDFQLVSSSLFGAGTIPISDSAIMAITNGLPEGG